MPEQYPRGYYPGMMYGEDVDPRTGKPLDLYNPLVTPVPDGSVKAIQVRQSRDMDNRDITAPDGSVVAIPTKRQRDITTPDGSVKVRKAQPDGSVIAVPRIPNGSVIATPRKTQYQQSLEALDNHYGEVDGSVKEVPRYGEVDGSVTMTRVPTSFDKGVKELDALEEASGPLPRATIGTDTGSGNREAPAPRSNMADASELERYKVFVKANPTIAAKVKPGQAGYEEIQAILNGGKEGGPSAQEVLDFADDSGYKADEASAILGGGSVESVIDSNGISTTITTPQTTSDPASPQDGTSGVPDVFDQSRSLSIPGVDPQEFLSKKVKSVGDILAGETNPDRFIFKD